jgi:dTDP-glucose 4,6-dehydratase
MKILVTGGAGFIGSNFVRLMLNKYPEYTIINIDKLTYAGNPENVKDITSSNHIKIFGEKGDICNIETLNELFQTHQPDVVVNFAAESHVDNSILNSSEFIKTNILGVDNLLKLSLKYNIKKYLQVSTDEVYGSLELTELPKKEDDKLKPRSPYSAAKAAADLLTLSYFITHNLPTLITRGANTYGPYHHPEKLIPKFITNLIQGKKLPLMGDGENIRDWLHVYDHCSAIDIILHKGEPGQIYNISPNNEKTNKEITLTLLKEFNFGEEMIQPIEHRKGHDFRYSIDASKLQDLGWEAKYKELALQEVIDWYKQNESWWRPLLKDVKY